MLSVNDGQEMEEEITIPSELPLTQNNSMDSPADNNEAVLMRICRCTGNLECVHKACLIRRIIESNIKHCEVC